VIILRIYISNHFINNSLHILIQIIYLYIIRMNIHQYKSSFILLIKTYLYLDINYGFKLILIYFSFLIVKDLNTKTKVEKYFL